MKSGGLQSTVPVASGQVFTQVAYWKMSLTEAAEGLLTAD